MPAQPDEGKGRQEGEPPHPGEPTAGEVDSEAQEAGGGRFDLNRLEAGGEEDDEEPHFLGDSALLYSHDAAESTPLAYDDGFPGLRRWGTQRWCCWTWAPMPTSCLRRGLEGMGCRSGR